MRETVDAPGKELTVTFTDAYTKTLSKFHGMLVKPVFKLAMKACPYRKDFSKSWVLIKLRLLSNYKSG